ncbi:MAG: response regulator [Desulfofustis sp.]|jgi:signal transduction histidine kinase/DNA-binding response OmpR family regulator|nr:response regulator [Desulfofustis sp.]
MTLLSLATTGIALLLLFSLALVVHVRQLRETMADHLLFLAAAISQTGLPEDGRAAPETAQKLVTALEVDEDIELAALYDAQARVVAAYQRGDDDEHALWQVAAQEVDARLFLANNSFHLLLSQIIRQGEKNLGRVVLVSRLPRLEKQMVLAAVAMLFGMGLFVVVNHLAARRLQRAISEPVDRLAATARRITELGDYSIRVEQGGRDEIGGLIDHFNSMLDAIQVRDRELHQHRHNLELLVEERTEELRRRRDEALAASQAKTEFLANMSHEIRTPMNGVIGVLSLLKDAPLSEEHRRLLATAARSADSLLHIINDILDFSKIDAGMIEFESIPFDVGQLVEEVALLYVDAVNLRNIDLLCQVPPDLGGKIQGDPTRLRQILTNLLSNAVKFTKAGQIVLRVECIEVSEQKLLLRFVVKDSGIGIPEKHLPRLFEKFTQADGSITRHYGGTGLGLSVCKQLVELQGGDIGAYSRLGEGTEFWFTMPFTTSDGQPATRLVNTIQDELILLVIGNQTARVILESYLLEAGARVVCCRDHSEALEQLREAAQHGRSYDTIILDEAFYDESHPHRFLEHRGISEEKAGPRLILLCRRTASFSTRFPDGVAAIVYQPILRAQLVEALNGAAEQHLGVAESVAGARPVLPGGTILLVDDEPINRMVVCAILERFGLVVHSAANGREAIERAAAHRYQIILMDIQMPEMSGYEATERIRSRELTDGREPTVIIAMTANALKSTRMRCLQSGMDDFISKPINPEMLAERLRPWFAGNNVTAEQLGEKSQHEMDDGEIGLLWSRPEALHLAGGDPALLRGLIKLFLERHGLLLARVEQAIMAEDPQQLDDAAHALKGALNHFCAARAHREALLLEMRGKSGEMSDCAEIFSRLTVEVARLTELLARETAEANGNSHQLN